MTPADFKSARATLGIPQRVMAEKLCITRSHLGKIEAGIAKPSATLVKLLGHIMIQHEASK